MALLRDLLRNVGVDLQADYHIRSGVRMREGIGGGARSKGLVRRGLRAALGAVRSRCVGVRRGTVNGTS